MVPQPDVLDGEVVLLEVLRRQVLLRRELLLLDLGEAVGQARVLDVLLQVGFLGDDLVGDDLEFLDEGGVDARPRTDTAMRSRTAAAGIASRA